MDQIGSVFEDSGFDAFIKSQVQGDLKSHHLFKVAVSNCANGCSMPQIVDFGIIQAGPVTITENPCSQCGACVRKCLEKAIVLDPVKGPEIVSDRQAVASHYAPLAHQSTSTAEGCLHCGQCALVCKFGTIVRKPTAFRVMVGGKLGRHPRLATELPGLFSRTGALRVMKACLQLLMENHTLGWRFANLFSAFSETSIVNLLPAADYQGMGSEQAGEIQLQF